jgi:hypothetical protein
MKNRLITTDYYPIRENFASFNKISETKIRAIIRYFCKKDISQEIPKDMSEVLGATESAGQVAKN